MAKYKITETYTPDDRDLERGREEIEFTCDSQSPFEIVAAGLRALDRDPRDYDTLKDELDDQEYELDGCYEFLDFSNDGEYHWEVEAINAD